MGRFLLLLGFILIIASIALMMVMLQDPEQNTFTAQIFNAVVCRPDEKIQQVLGGYVRSGTSSTSGWGRELTFYCVNPEDQQRDVTLNAVMTIAGAFAIPFIVGLIMTMIGSFALVGGMVRKVTSSVMSGATVRTSNPVVYTTTYSTQDGTMTEEQMAKVKGVLGNFMDVSQMDFTPTAGTTVVTGGQGMDLTTRLQQLEDARSKGLISQSEYDRARQDLLNNFSE